MAPSKLYFFNLPDLEQVASYLSCSLLRCEEHRGIALRGKRRKTSQWDHSGTTVSQGLGEPSIGLTAP